MTNKDGAIICVLVFLLASTLTSMLIRLSADECTIRQDSIEYKFKCYEVSP